MVRNPTRAETRTPGWRSLRGPWLWLMPPAFFVIVAVLEATHGWIGYRLAGEPVIGLTLQGQPLTWPALVARTLPSWLLVGVLAPFVILLARGFPLAGPRWKRNVAVQLAGAVTFAAVFLMGASFFRYHLFLAGQTGLTWRFTLLRYYAVYFNTFFFIYWSLVAVHSAFSNQARHHDALVLEKQLAEARLRTLQAQLRPHFLFNALNAISTLARAGERRTVVRMLAGLSDLLRASFRDGASALIPLREELALVRHYLDLEKLRFADRLSIAVDADPDVLDVQVPRLVLQPLVENAVRHGIATSHASGSVTIEAKRMGDALELRVRDTGPGPQHANRNGTGLSNTRGRLEHLYAGRASLELTAAPGGGALATLRLPCSFDRQAVAAGV
jgi:signal transduction histidine kinase